LSAEIRPFRAGWSMLRSMPTTPPSSGTDRTPPRLLRQDEVAELLGVSPRTVRSFAAAGDLPKVVLGRRSTRYRISDVEALIDARILHRDDDPAAPGRVDKSARQRRRDEA